MILDAYYDSLRRLIGAGEQGKRLTQVGFGTNEAEARPDDAALSEDAVLIDFQSVEYADDDPRLLTLFFELGKDQGNGLIIREMGLFTADGTLVARKTREPLTKTDDMRLGESWRLLV